MWQRRLCCCKPQTILHIVTIACRVIVPDLPAHGARFKEVPLTLDNAIKTLEDVISQEAQGEKVRALDSVNVLLVMLHGICRSYLRSIRCGQTLAVSHAVQRHQRQHCTRKVGSL
jgi:hypothetical protein